MGTIGSSGASEIATVLNSGKVNAASAVASAGFANVLMRSEIAPGTGMREIKPAMARRFDLEVASMASTTAGSNCEPALSTSSCVALSSLSEVRPGRG